MSSRFFQHMGLLLVLIAASLSPAEALASRFRIEVLEQGRERAYVLRDSRTNSLARICPGAGNECTVLRLPGPDGKLHDLLPPLRPGTEVTSGTRKGIPILFPWPGRIPGGMYEFQGKRFQLKTSGRRTQQAMHGLVETRRWRVERAEADEHSARLTCRITAADCPDTQAGYPFAWSLRVTHELSSTGLSLRAEVRNLGTTGSMPFGFGLHPWLRAPLGSSGRTEECLVQVPAERIWNGQAIESLTVERAAAPRTSPAIVWQADCPPALSLMKPALLGSRQTALYTGLQAENGGMVESRLIDPAAGLETVLQSTPNLGTLVLFKSREGGSVCLEPWSCPPNVFNLANRIGKESGLVVLSPGEKWESEVRVGLRSASAPH